MKMLQSNIRKLLLVSVVCICGVAAIPTGSRSSQASMWIQPMAQKLEHFTFNLYRHLSPGLSDDENMVISPISIYSALSIIGEGSDGETRRQIKRALHTPNFEDPQVFFRNTFFKKSDYSVSMAQRVFLDNSTLLKKDFKDFLNETGLPGIKKMSFQANPGLCRRKINNWVSHNTMDQIQELLDEGQVTELTRLYIVNAIALEASWRTPFEFTAQTQFQLSADQSISMEMMRDPSQKCMFTNTAMDPVANTKFLTDTTVMVLPFTGEKLTYIAAMPNNPGDFSELDTRVGQKKLLNMMNNFWSRKTRDNRLLFHTCDVTMPKFNLEYDYQDLKLDLIDMGVEDVFDAGLADLSKLLREGDGLHVTDVAHKATFAVDENGVRATAATAFGISLRMMPPSVTINKPFLFFVRNMDTGALLFMGKVVNPTNS